jgi:hypothetical protein
MEIKQENVDNSGRFYVEENGETLAEMDYKIPAENLLLITHTEVSDKLAGKGVGKQLISAAVNHARKKSLKVQSVCSFAKAILDKTPDFADVYSAGEKNS